MKKLILLLFLLPLFVTAQIQMSQVNGLVPKLNSKQDSLHGTGFIKISGKTISYDNSTYLTTETEPSFNASVAKKITASDTVKWNSKQDSLVSGINIKTINGSSIKGSGNLSIVAGGGGAGANVYLSDVNSSVSGYKTSSPNIDATEAVKTITASTPNTIYWGEKYLYTSPIATTNIPSGLWSLHTFGYVNSAVGISNVVFRIFKYSGSTETVLFTFTGYEVDNIEASEIIITGGGTETTLLATDYLGIQVGFQTTAATAKTFTYTIGNGHASYSTNPLPLRHDGLRDKNGNNDYLHATLTQINSWNSKEPGNANIQAHIASNSNPHNVTKAQVGLPNADNTSDLNKPISTATQTALNGKQNQLNGTGFVKASGTTLSYDNNTYSTDIHSNITALNDVLGSNHGDETLTSIKTKLGAANSTTDGYIKYQDWNTFNNKVSNATHTGDVSGSTALTLATVNSNVGTYNNITINAKGLATAGSNVSYLVASDIAGKKNTSDSTAIDGYTRRDRLASELSKKQNTITTGTTSQYFRGDLSLATFPTIPAAQVQTDWNATTGLGVLLNKPSSLPASDVYSWAKASTKPTYTYSEVGALSSGTSFRTVNNVSVVGSGDISINPFPGFGTGSGAAWGYTAHPTTISGYGITDIPSYSGTNFILNQNSSAQSANMWISGNAKGNTLESTVATGTAPLTVNSTTMVENLNAKYLGGYNSNSLNISNSANTQGDNINWNTAEWNPEKSLIFSQIAVPNYTGQTNAPFQNYGTLITLGNSYTLFPFQIAIGSGSSGIRYRCQYNSLSFTANWTSLWTTDNFTPNSIATQSTSSLSTNYLPKWNGNSFVNSLISDDGSGGVKINSTTASTSPTTGALVVGGGIGAKQISLSTGSSCEFPTLGSRLGSLFLGGDNGLYGTYFGTSSSLGIGWIQQMRNDAATAYALNLNPVGGNVGVGYTSDQGYKLAVNGTGSFNGALTATSFNGSGSNLTGVQKPITLTTAGTSGAATFSGNTLNVPNYGESAGRYISAKETSVGSYNLTNNDCWVTCSAATDIYLPSSSTSGKVFYIRSTPSVAGTTVHWDSIHQLSIDGATTTQHTIPLNKTAMVVLDGIYWNVVVLN